jgi:hypothetical protein
MGFPVVPVQAYCIAKAGQWQIPVFTAGQNNNPPAELPARLTLLSCAVTVERPKPQQQEVS